MNELAKKGNEPSTLMAERTRGGTTYVPRFDIVETDDGISLYGDMPGVTPEKLDIRFENDHLTIFGEVECLHEDWEHLYGEYGIGDFHREFHIEEPIDADKISAELKNGVLRVLLPKTEASKPKRIEVKGG